MIAPPPLHCRFSYTMYDQTYTSIDVSSNGNSVIHRQLTSHLQQRVPAGHRQLHRLGTLSTRTGTICGRISAVAAMFIPAEPAAFTRRFRALRPTASSTSNGAPSTFQRFGTAANFELGLYEGQTSLRRDLRQSGQRQYIGHRRCPERC